MMDELKSHTIILEGVSPSGTLIRLRPLTEMDWDVLLQWNNDPEMLYYAEEDEISSYTLDEVKLLYCSVSSHAYCFIIEVDGAPVGECWLQEMNLERVLGRYPGLDVRRIDLAIGEKEWWNKGIGTMVIWLLTEFGFQQEDADLIYEPGIADYNLRSLRAFQKVGYETIGALEGKPGGKARYLYDLALTRDQFLARKAG